MRRLLHGASTSLEIMRSHERRPPDTVVKIRDTSVALQLLRGFMSDPSNMMALRVTLADGNASASVSRLADHEVLRQLAWQIVSGHAVLVSRIEVVHRPAAAAEAAEPAAEAVVKEPARAERSWIEIEMVDELGVPVAGDTYEIELPDGSIRRGSLDSRGRARIIEIDPGTCKIQFPDLDAGTWGPL